MSFAYTENDEWVTEVLAASAQPHQQAATGGVVRQQINIGLVHLRELLYDKRLIY
jgi:hypothetical protein